MSLEQSNPLVTVYIPTFNRVELLKRAVESVRHQTYQNLEIIIVDDCSKDGTHAYLEEIKKQDSRIQYFIKDINSGACISRNIAINNAKGEFITGLDDDDYFKKNRIAIFLEKWIHKKHTTIALCTSTYSEESKKRNIFNILGDFFSKKNISSEDLYFANYVGNQVFVETKSLRNLGGFDKYLKAWQDLDMWLRLSKTGNIEKIYIPTYYVDRSHDLGRITTSNIDKMLEVKNYFIEKHKITNPIYLRAFNNHLIHYDPSKVSFKDLFVKIFFNFDLKGNLIYLVTFFKKKYW